jgi:membrane protease YdiL (CAAX protease family)
MKSWQPHQRLLLFLLLATAIACAISPILSLGADWFMTQWPALMSRRIPFHRTFNGAFIIACIILFIPLRRSLFTTELKKLFLLGHAAARRDLFTGLGLATGSILLIVCALTVADIFTPIFRFRPSVALSRIASAAATGVSVGFFEELFFRGILFMGLSRHRYDIRAYLLANLFYSALHFVKPGEAYFIDSLDLSAGFRHWAYTLKPFLEPLSLLPGLVGLWVIGAVLSFAVERTGGLYLAIGLHAGWVFGIKSLRVFGDLKRDQLGFLFGSTDPRLVSGVVTWAAILLTGVGVYYLTKPRAVGSSDLPRAIKG